MNTTTFRLGIVCAVVVASIATPMVIKHNAAVSLRENNAALRQQTGRLAQLAGENQRLSNLVAQAKPSLSDEQFRELLRLRGEMGMLRQQTNAIQKLRAENRRLAARLTTAQKREVPMSPAQFEEELLTEKREAMSNICRELQPALQRFANDHTNQTPYSLYQLRDYFPASEGPMAGLFSFGFVRGRPPIVVAGDALILRDTELHQKPDGKWARFYAYGDGRIVEATSEDGNFDAWEKEHAIVPSISQ